MLVNKAVGEGFRWKDVQRTAVQLSSRHNASKDTGRDSSKDARSGERRARGVAPRGTGGAVNSDGESSYSEQDFGKHCGERAVRGIRNGE